MEGYTPTFYLNGRKISSVNEVKNIDVKSISQNGHDLVSGDNFVNDKTSKHHLNAYIEKNGVKSFLLIYSWIYLPPKESEISQ